VLIAKYGAGSLDFNYLQFFRDIENIPAEPAAPKTWSFGQRGREQPQEFSAEMTALLERLRVGFFRSRVRPVDFFADHDKLRSGLVTENQFVCGSTLILNHCS
jgi:hypothetical protein